MLNIHNLWYRTGRIKAALRKDANVVRIGVLGAAAINPEGIFDPVDTHPSAVITALGARSRERAERQIKHYRLDQAKAYGSYAEVLEAPDVDAVYIPLPNGLHLEWTLKALQAGKHVLCEKTLASNAQQVQEIRQMAAKTGKVVLEAFHWRFHPANHALLHLLRSGKYGEVESISSTMILPRGILARDDIRFQYELGGGACIDMAYVFSGTTVFAGWDVDRSVVRIESARAKVNRQDPKVDDEVEVDFVIETPGKRPVQCHVQASLALAPALGFIPKYWAMSPSITIELEKAQIDFPAFVQPAHFHQITITPKQQQGKTEKISVYVDGPEWAATGSSQRGQRWWTTYRYQLEAFVDMIQSRSKGGEYRGPRVDLAESERLMSVIDSVYDKMGLPRRGLK